MVEQNSGIDSIFRAIADPTRRQMLEALASRDRTIGELADPLDMTLAGASKHIGVLEKAGLVRRQKQGRERICTLRGDGLHAVRDWVEQYSAFWTGRLDALEVALKENPND